MSGTYGIEAMRPTRTLANGRALGPHHSISTDDPGLQPGLCKRVGLWPAVSHHGYQRTSIQKLNPFPGPVFKPPFCGTKVEPLIDANQR